MATNAKVIAVLNQKGGCGKSTIAITLADGLLREGKQVTLIDTDTQQTSGDWAAMAAHNDLKAPLVMGITRPTLDVEIKNLPDVYDYAVIDSISGLSPFSMQIVASTIKAADLVVIPILPSSFDMWATSKVVDMIEERRAITEGKPKAAFLMNMVRPGTQMKEALEGAVGKLSLPHFDTEFVLAEDFRKPMTQGKTVFALPDSNPNKRRAQCFIEEVKEILSNE